MIKLSIKGGSVPMKEIKPFYFTEYGQEEASVTLEADMKYQLFEKHGIAPNGYSWTHVLQTYLATSQPAIAKSIKYDSEAGMFACTGPKELVKQAAMCFSELYNNEVLLEEILSNLSLQH
ncbi:hypothetical protein GIX45_17280 [Erwinia sp. CPCC 100877]|nr:hypothetical protein [Erwinia sp. CPCC 100877]